jgi:hypothetical protein
LWSSESISKDTKEISKFAPPLWGTPAANTGRDGRVFQRGIFDFEGVCISRSAMGLSKPMPKLAT